jgi:branched-subunit amino acid transport protein
VEKLIPILLMAIITYLIRSLPMILLREKIKSPLIQSFLHYIPYCILTAMIVPSIFTSTHLPLAAIGGTITALILAWFEKSLITVSMSAVAVAYILEVLL